MLPFDSDRERYFSMRHNCSIFYHLYITINRHPTQNHPLRHLCTLEKIMVKRHKLL